MPKSECFFTWRATWNGAPHAVVTQNAAESRTWLEVSIEECDPFQSPERRFRERRFRAIASGEVSQ